MNFERVLNKINELEARRQGILINHDLSLEGKRRARELWETEKAQSRIEAISLLKADISTLRRGFAENEKRRAAAQEQAAKRWDWNRLQFEVTNVQAVIANLPNGFTISGIDFVTEFSRMYQTVLHSQDTHKRRAYCETGAEYLQLHFPNDAKAKTLADTLRGDLKKLLTTPELDACEMEGARLAALGLKVIQSVKTIKNYYLDGNEAIFGGANAFDEMLKGVRVEYGDIDGPTGQWKITLFIDTETGETGATEPY